MTRVERAMAALVLVFTAFAALVIGWWAGLMLVRYPVAAATVGLVLAAWALAYWLIGRVDRDDA
jgi:hypothetical protein